MQTHSARFLSPKWCYNKDIQLKGRIRLYTVCKEHVDEALDMIVDEEERIPQLELLKEEELSTTCTFCKEAAVYKVH